MSQLMNLTKLLTLTVALGVGLNAADAQDADCQGCPECGCAEGGQFVEVTQTRCKMVTEKVPVKKKVFECKEVPYCEHALPELGKHHCCPKCAACAKTKKVLIVKNIKCGEKTETKCVPEEVKVMVPVACPKCGHRCLHKHHRLGQSDLPELELPKVPRLEITSELEQVVVDSVKANQFRLSSSKKDTVVGAK